MTVAIFLGSLLGTMALGMPIAYALLLCGVALMYHLNMFEAQIIAQNLINGADSFPLIRSVHPNRGGRGCRRLFAVCRHGGIPGAEIQAAL